MKDMAPARSAGKSQGGIVGARALWHMSQILNSNEAGGGSGNHCRRCASCAAERHRGTGMTYRKLLGSAAATALVCGAAHGTPLPGASVTGSIDLGSGGYTGDPAYRQTITGTGDYAQLLSGPHGSASEVVHIRTARSPRASIYEMFSGLPINGYGGTASVGVTISDALEINGPSGVVNIHERDAGVFKMYSSYPNGQLLAASSSVQLTDVFSRGTSDQRYFLERAMPEPLTSGLLGRSPPVTSLRAAFTPFTPTCPITSCFS